MVFLDRCSEMADSRVSTSKVIQSEYIACYFGSFRALPVLCGVSVVQRNRDALEPLIGMKRSDYGLPEDKFLFACFNQLYKMDPEIFSTWYVADLVIIMLDIGGI